MDRQQADGSDPTFLARLDLHSHPDAIRQHVDKVLGAHHVIGRAVDRAWRAVPASGRNCIADGETWPCKAVQWARTHKTSTLASWSL